MPRQLTPREEFESKFGSITDDDWQWLKEFLLRHPVTGVHDGNVVYEVFDRPIEFAEVRWLKELPESYDEPKLKTRPDDFVEPFDRSEHRWSEEWLRKVIQEEIAMAAGKPVFRNIREPRGG